MYSFIHSSVIQVISVDERKSQPIQTDAETTARVVSSFINDYFPPLSGCNILEAPARKDGSWSCQSRKCHITTSHLATTTTTIGGQRCTVVSQLDG